MGGDGQKQLNIHELLEEKQQNLSNLITSFNGIGKTTYKLLILRFEFIKMITNRKISLLTYSPSFSKSINILLSKMTSIDTPIKELQILHILRLYLLKTYQGKSHMLGKPVRGQRT